MIDINSLISQYLQNNGEADLNRISSAVQNLASATSDNDLDCIFELANESETVTEDDFVQIMCNASGKTPEQIQDDVSVLFDILDSEASGKGELSKNELSIFMDDNKVSSFRIWDKLMGYKEDTVYSIMSESEEAEEAEETEETSGASESDAAEETDEADESQEAAAASDSDEVDEEDLDTLQAGNEAEETEADVNAGGKDFSDKETAKSFVNAFLDDNLNTPKKVIDWLLENNKITDEEAALLENAYKSYSDSDQRQIDALVSTGMSEAEAIEFLESSGKINPGSSTINQENASTISDSDVKLYADQLYDSMSGLGTDDEQFDSIFNNPSLTGADMVKIISYYNDNYGSFIQDVDDDFSGGKQDQIQTRVADLLIESAESGNEEAIEMLCKEFHNGTAGQWLTANEFIDRILNSASDNVIGKMARKYAEYTGSDIFKDIKGDFSFGTEDSYINRINTALINTDD